MTQSNFSEKDNSSNIKINKVHDHTNRGVDFLINGGKKKQIQPFHIIFEKMVCFLNREVNIYFEFSFTSKSRKKKRSSPEKENVSS